MRELASRSSTMLIAAGVAAAISQRGNSRWWLVIGGVLWIFGGVLFAAGPGTGALAIALWLGIVALAWGIASVVAGIMLRRESAAA